MKEIVPSKPMFMVDREGNVFWRKTGARLSPFTDKDGYKRITYRISGKSYHVAVHRAVAEVFVKNLKPDLYTQVNHKDSDRSNNSVDNLEWVSPRLNTAHAVLRKRFSARCGENHPQTKLSLDDVHMICKKLSLGDKVSSIAKELSQPRHRVMNIKTGKCWRDISEIYNLDIPENKNTISLDFLKEEKESLGITQEEYFLDYGVIKEV